MIILDKKYSISELSELASSLFIDMLKAVVDIEKRIVAVDAELHSDLELLLLENGSFQENLWGINIYPLENEDSFIEFDSLINIRPSVGNRSRYVENEETRMLIIEIVKEYVLP